MGVGTANLDGLLGQTAELATRILQLPAVATPDWCDRAAACLTALDGARLACVLIWLRENKKAPTLEACGVCAREGEQAGVRLRTRLEREFRLGALTPADTGAQGVRVELLGDSGVDGRARLWQGLDAGEVVCAAIALDEDAGGRGVECLVALDRDAGGGEIESTLRAVAPTLRHRAALALAPGEAGQSPWLTDRENMVLARLVEGLSVRRIAERIGRSPHTVHDHVKNLHRKLGASTRGALVARALGYDPSIASSRGMGRAGFGALPGALFEAKGEGSRGAIEQAPAPGSPGRA